MTHQQYADHAGISRQLVTKMVAAGMPLDSAAAADQWRRANVRQRRGSPPLPTPPGPPPPEAKLPPPPADATEGPYRPPEAAAPAVAKASDPTPGGAYERARQIERAAYALAAQALKEQRADAKFLVATHATAARNLAQIRLDVLAAQERERILVSGDWVRKVMLEHDGALVSLVKSMPKQLAGRISPHDPEHAQAELERWAEEVFLRTLYNTNPFPEASSG